MITSIAAVSQNGIIGVTDSNGVDTIPWIGRYSSDLRRFKKLTLNNTVIMGSKTWKSIWEKPLPNRTNMIISSKLYPENLSVKSFNSIQLAIDSSVYENKEKDIWIIGGASIYEQSMDLIDQIDLTIIPEKVITTNYKKVVRFPWINPNKFKIISISEGLEGLTHVGYSKI